MRVSASEPTQSHSSDQLAGICNQLCNNLALSMSIFNRKPRSKTSWDHFPHICPEVSTLTVLGLSPKSISQGNGGCNEAVVTILGSRYCKEPALMHMLRVLFFAEAHFQFRLVAQHIPGTCNALADHCLETS